jgi:hypothetical protein
MSDNKKMPVNVAQGVKEYLIENLRIEIQQDNAFDPVDTITVSLSLEGVYISEDMCIIPKQD